MPGPRSEVRIRTAVPADAPIIARVHVDSWRTTYRGLVPDAFLAALSYERRESWWDTLIRQASPEQFTLVIEQPPGIVVGFASGGPSREDPVAAGEGEVYAIYLLAEWQRRGLGSRLLRSAAAELIARGMDSMLVWVLAGNPARCFYAALGGAERGRKSIEIGGAHLDEIAYHWPDLRILAGRPA